MVTLFIVLALLVGAGGTVAASDSARPGDLLFPIDRAVEDIRATFASTDNKVELKIKFSEERLDEIESILDDESSTTTPNGVSEEATQNLSYALDILTMHLADIHGLASTTPGIAQALSVIEARLQQDANSLPQELKIKIRDDRGRIELKTEEGKIKVKIKNGEVEVEVKSEDEDEEKDESKDDEDREDKKGSNSGPGSFGTSTKSDDDDSATSTKSDDDEEEAQDRSKNQREGDDRRDDLYDGT